jgi:putative transposase
VQHNHVHLIVEAGNRRRMSEGLRALLIRVARGLNRVMGSSGARFADRFHEHVLKTPNEVRNALRYVIGNRASHLARWGRVPTPAFADPFSSIASHAPISPPESWLLLKGWTRAGPI